MTRSSELVMRLNGSEASDGTEFDLVFGRSEGRPLLMTLLRSEECTSAVPGGAGCIL